MNTNSYGMWRTGVLVDFLQVRRRTLRRKRLVFPLLPCRCPRSERCLATVQNFYNKCAGGWSCISTTPCKAGELRSKDSANPCQKGGFATCPTCKTCQVACTLILTRLVFYPPSFVSLNPSILVTFIRPASVQTWRHFALLAFGPPSLLTFLPRPALL